jgi:hypothetical protein
MLISWSRPHSHYSPLIIAYVWKVLIRISIKPFIVNARIYATFFKEKYEKNMKKKTQLNTIIHGVFLASKGIFYLCHWTSLNVTYFKRYLKLSLMRHLTLFNVKYFKRYLKLSLMCHLTLFNVKYFKR